LSRGEQLNEVASGLKLLLGPAHVLNGDLADLLPKQEHKVVLSLFGLLDKPDQVACWSGWLSLGNDAGGGLLGDFGIAGKLVDNTWSKKEVEGAVTMVAVTMGGAVVVKGGASDLVVMVAEMIPVR